MKIMYTIYAGIWRFFPGMKPVPSNKVNINISKWDPKGAGNPYPHLTLADLFESPAKFEFIRQIMVNRKMIHPITGLWIDFAKGNKEYMIALLKKLHVQGYYKRNLRLSNQQIQAVCLNSFGVMISLGYIKHIESDDINLDFIPAAALLGKN